ncbi:isocitrate lyase/phosphoenolpyruvate mutase family protein [Streptomyces sp. Y1]|uniref:Isocitrate lyase/phosphoenolpyruvate mutase family protein n=1 Tax=Streptomyces sp. Y1 TaxID=3238634 RepID=A0AB39TCI9_9ACTN
MASQRDKAVRFRELHVPGSPLVLANVWDVAGARVVAATGAPAVATTSAGVAWALGAPDGDRLDRADALALIRRVARALDVPVTVDVEGGFGATPGEVAHTVEAVIEAGAVGINIEDGDRHPADFAERLAAARHAADRAAVPLYINARTDVYFKGIGEPEGRLDETLARAARYLEAGASGIFVPFATTPDDVASLTRGIAAPVNVLAAAGAPSVAELAALGVARVSLGSNIAAAVYALVRRAAEELATTGTYASLAETIPYQELNRLLTDTAQPR